MENYLNEINQVTFNNQFGTKLNAQLENINENFKRLMAVPFYKGDKGNDVKEIYIDISGATVYSSGSEEKALYTAIRNALFMQLYGTTNNCPKRDGYDVGGMTTSSWDYIDPTTGKVRLYRSIKSGSTYSYVTCGMFIFLDGRINYLPYSDTTIDYFEDKSCAFVISGESTMDINGNWTASGWYAKKISIVPTIYFDNNVKEWCWRINGVETGVRCQGVQGEQGVKSASYVCGGRALTENDQTVKIKLDKVIMPENITDVKEIEDDSLISCWFTESTVTDANYDDFTFGISYTVDENKYISYPKTSGNNVLSFKNVFTSLKLYEALEGVGNDEEAVRGLFVKTRDTNNKAHMAWTENSANTLNIGFVEENYKRGKLSSSVTPLEGAILNNNYKIIVLSKTNKISVENDLNINNHNKTVEIESGNISLFDANSTINGGKLAFNNTTTTYPSSLNQIDTQITGKDTIYHSNGGDFKNMLMITDLNSTPTFLSGKRVYEGTSIFTHRDDETKKDELVYTVIEDWIKIGNIVKVDGKVGFKSFERKYEPTIQLPFNYSSFINFLDNGKDSGKTYKSETDVGIRFYFPIILEEIGETQRICKMSSGNINNNYNLYKYPTTTEQVEHIHRYNVSQLLNGQAILYFGEYNGTQNTYDVDTSWNHLVNKSLNFEIRVCKEYFKTEEGQSDIENTIYAWTPVSRYPSMVQEYSVDNHILNFMTYSYSYLLDDNITCSYQ